MINFFYCVNTDSHVKPLEINDCSHIPNDPNHLKTHEDCILSFFRWISFINVRET